MAKKKPAPKTVLDVAYESLGEALLDASKDGIKFSPTEICFFVGVVTAVRAMDELARKHGDDVDRFFAGVAALESYSLVKLKPVGLQLARIEMPQKGKSN